MYGILKNFKSLLKMTNTSKLHQILGPLHQLRIAQNQNLPYYFFPVFFVVVLLFMLSHGSHYCLLSMFVSYFFSCVM